ncbi:histone-like bacterial DNA-binding protein [Prevotella sp. CAG:891]|nr:histone-like bacterial DNA-binding protein [Prevotella sp. CAG:891]
MNNKDFLNALALRTGMNAKTVQKATQTLIGEFVERLDADTSLSVQGFGQFEVKKKKERIAVNPATKQRKLIPPKLVLAFKPSAVLKEKLK